MAFAQAMGSMSTLGKAAHGQNDDQRSVTGEQMKRNQWPRNAPPLPMLTSRYGKVSWCVRIGYTILRDDSGFCSASTSNRKSGVSGSGKFDERRHMQARHTQAHNTACRGRHNTSRRQGHGRTCGVSRK